MVGLTCDYSFMLNFLQTFIENGLAGAMLKKLYLSISSIFIDMQRLGNLWWLGHFYQTFVKNCLVNFLQWNARRLIFSNSSSVQLGGKSHSPITNDDFCLYNGRERKWLLSPDQCSSKHYKKLRTQSRWAQNIKPLKLVVAAYIICYILQLIHTLKNNEAFSFLLNAFPPLFQIPGVWSPKCSVWVEYKLFSLYLVWGQLHQQYNKSPITAP